MTKLSACIVTYNEAENITACLESVAFADEIIVIDSNSTDNTREIAKELGAQVYIQDFAGCGAQKATAIAKATNPWVLILDADERVTSELAAEIQNTLKNPKHSGYLIPFRTYYCNKKLKFGDALFEKHLRLFKKAKATIEPRLVHFKVDLNGTTGNLKKLIKHYSFKNLESVLEKMNRYSSQSATLKKQQGKSSSLLSAVLKGFFTFVRCYILKLGFLDGKTGFIFAFSNAEGCYYKYLKLNFLK